MSRLESPLEERMRSFLGAPAPKTKAAPVQPVQLLPVGATKAARKVVDKDKANRRIAALNRELEDLADAKTEMEIQRGYAKAHAQHAFDYVLRVLAFRFNDIQTEKEDVAREIRQATSNPAGYRINQAEEQLNQTLRQAGIKPVDHGDQPAYMRLATGEQVDVNQIDWMAVDPLLITEKMLASIPTKTMRKKVQRRIREAIQALKNPPEAQTEKKARKPADPDQATYRAPWTDEEDTLLFDVFVELDGECSASKRNADIAETLNATFHSGVKVRSSSAVLQRLRTLDLLEKRGPSSDDNSEPAIETSQAPARSTCYTSAQEMPKKRRGPKPGTKLTPWSREEEADLLRFVDTALLSNDLLTSSGIAATKLAEKYPGRPRTVRACQARYIKASTLGYQSKARPLPELTAKQMLEVTEDREHPRSRSRGSSGTKRTRANRSSTRNAWSQEEEADLTAWMRELLPEYTVVEAARIVAGRLTGKYPGRARTEKAVRMMYYETQKPEFKSSALPLQTILRGPSERTARRRKSMPARPSSLTLWSHEEDAMCKRLFQTLEPGNRGRKSRAKIIADKVNAVFGNSRTEKGVAARASLKRWNDEP